MRPVGLAALAALVLLGAAPGPCASVGECIARIRDVDAWQPAQEARSEIARFGDAGVVALLPLLRDPNPRIREQAAWALAGFDRIDARHVPAMLAAFSKPDHLLAYALAATGSDEALVAIQQAFLRETLLGGEYYTPAIAKFGTRAWPFVRAQLARCRDGREKRHCDQLMKLVKVGDDYPDWGARSLVELATSPRTSDGMRRNARYQLVADRKPEVIPLVIETLAERSRRKRGDDSASEEIRWLAGFGDKAIAAGPLIAAYIPRADLRDTQLEAVLAVGRIGYRPAIPLLAAFTPREFEDDWRLAYNTVESLARLGAVEQRPMIERLAANHWHAPVRNNARRALSLLAGGPFAQPGIEGDAEPFPGKRGEGRRDVDRKEVRYGGDFDGSTWFTRADPKQPVPLPQAPPGIIEAPPRGSLYLDTVWPSQAQLYAFLAAHPEFKDNSFFPLMMRVRDGMIVGTANGEWGGGIAWVRGREIRWLLGNDASAAFWWGGRFYVLTDARHMDIGPGTLSEIDLDAMRVVRSIRLPHNPERIAVSSKGALVIETRNGAIAILRDGSPVDPALVSDD